VSFFEEDDEPLRTTRRARPRPRPRRGRPAGGAAVDSQTLYIRRALFVVGVIVFFVLLGSFVSSCRGRQAKNALKDYNTQVSNIATKSQQTGTAFLSLFRQSQPSPQQLQTSILSLKADADTTLKQAQGLNVPGGMTSAQQSLLISLELRRDALDATAGKIRTALGDSGEQADAAIKSIAGQMAALNASDVLYNARVVPFIRNELASKGIVAPVLRSQALGNVDWMSPQFIATKLDQQLTSGGAGAGKQQPTGPGLHGTGLNSTTVGTQVLSPGVSNQIVYTPGQTFHVAFTDQGDNDEFNIKVTVRIESSSGAPITLTTTVPKIAKGAKATADLPLDRTPPLNTAVTIRVTVAAVPGEKKTDNNKSAYPALFKRG
jgi:adhesin HecA-like repeat protein